ncbi:hypothetical protein [Endozoicomonas ascidiicola]|uniref:hypothetical protein n=1 Tax=Endozoicomonas ascidiicola TaxID=1698521 RepID=UPI0008363962|nr:hypothetical protein [Endozoicomonas ascidiicola]
MHTVEERACYLADALTRKYGEVFKTGKFNNEELNEFGPRLKSKIKANINLKKYVSERVTHCFLISGSYYEPEKVSHLRGITTNAKKTAYLVLNQYIGSIESDKEFIETAAQMLDGDSESVKLLLSEKIHLDVILYFKHDHGFPFELKIKEIKRRIIKQAKSKR